MRLVLLVALVACQTSDVSRRLGARCTLATECDQRCLTGGDWPGGLCTTACDTDASCDPGAACVDDNGGGVCVFACRTDPECAFLGGYRCVMVDRHGGGNQVSVCRGG